MTLSMESPRRRLPKAAYLVGCAPLRLVFGKYRVVKSSQVAFYLESGVLFGMWVSENGNRNARVLRVLIFERLGCRLIIASGPNIDGKGFIKRSSCRRLMLLCFFNKRAIDTVVDYEYSFGADSVVLWVVPYLYVSNTYR